MGLSELATEAAALSDANGLASPRRTILGLAGPPGAGKTTLAHALVAEINRLRPAFAINVPMDGFHFTNARLDELGLRIRKGAPQTFDIAAYAEKLQELRSNTQTSVFCPEYDRHGRHEPIEGVIEVPAAAGLIVTEGNYLLLDTEGWNVVRKLVDAVWYIDVPRETAVRRLLVRHRASGNDEVIVHRRVYENDLVNFDIVEATRGRADRDVTQLDFEPTRENME